MVWTLEQIDRGVFHAVRKAIVAMGYFPDILTFQPSNPSNVAAFKAAKQAIITGGKELIEVYGVGDNSSRDAQIINKIIIDRDIPKPGEIGFFGCVEFKADGEIGEVGTTYQREQAPAYTYKIVYEVTYISTSTKYDRILESIIRKALTKTFLYGYDENGVRMSEVFNFIYNSNPVNMTDEKYIERMYKFTAGDVILDENEVITSTITQLTEIYPEAIPVKVITDDLFEQSS